MSPHQTTGILIVAVFAIAFAAFFYRTRFSDLQLGWSVLGGFAIAIFSAAMGSMFVDANFVDLLLLKNTSAPGRGVLGGYAFLVGALAAFVIPRKKT